MWKKALAVCLVMITLCGAASAQTISPTTGLPLDGEPVAPMLAVISHAEGSTKVNGKTVKAAGVGKRQAWGGQQADIIYESMLYQDGCSRFLYLYHDALVRGETISAGPVRSVRSVHIELSKAWNAGLIFSAGTERSTPTLADVRERSYSRDREEARPYLPAIKGKKAPDCFSADVNSLHNLMADQTFTGSGFAFTDEKPDDALPSGAEMHITWGDSSVLKSVWSTHLIYDSEAGKYLCFSGKAPLKNFHDASCAEESQLAFDNVIVQHAAHAYPTRMLADVDLSSGGKAVILRGGKRVDAQWVNENGQTKFVDENGNEVPLSRGKTYIAFWDDGCGKLTYQSNSK